jgi:ribokinase
MTPAEAAVLTVLGAVNLDLTARVTALPAAGETVGGGSLSREPGGKGANQAVAAARLGARVRLVGAVGADGEGASMVSNLDAAGVDTSALQRVDEPTGTALIVVDDEGENSIVVCPGANGRIDPRRLQEERPDALLAQLEVDLRLVADLAQRTSGLVALNLSPVMPLDDGLRQRVDLFIVNEGEYAKVPYLATAPLVAVTLGGDGALLRRDGVVIARARADASTVVNTVGAGDTFAAALTVAMLRGIDDAAALQLACNVGAAAVADERSQPLLQPLEAYLGI